MSTVRKVGIGLLILGAATYMYSHKKAGEYSRSSLIATPTGSPGLVEQMQDMAKFGLIIAVIGVSITLFAR